MATGKPKSSELKLSEPKLSGNVIISELMRNMELGRFEMAYAVLLPCVFTIYLNPEDHATLSGVFELVIDDARKALRARVAELNATPSLFGVLKRNEKVKEFKIACRDWNIDFLADGEVPAGDVEIHSQLNEVVQPGYRGTRTTLIDRETPSPVHSSTTQRQETRRSPEPVFADIRYEDDSGPQVFNVTQNRVRIGRGGNDHPMDLALYTTDEVSREHLVIRRDPATGGFFIVDASTNGTWVNGKRLRKGSEDPLPGRAEIALGEILTLTFEVRL